MQMGRVSKGLRGWTSITSILFFSIDARSDEITVSTSGKYRAVYDPQFATSEAPQTATVELEPIVLQGKVLADENGTGFTVVAASRGVLKSEASNFESSPSTSVNVVGEIVQGHITTLSGPRRSGSPATFELTKTATAPSHHKLRRLGMDELSCYFKYRLYRLKARLASMTRPFKYPQYEEVRGQSSLAKLVAKVRMGRWMGGAVSRLRNVFGNMFSGQSGEPVTISNAKEELEVWVTRELGKTPASVDVLVKEGSCDWSGRLYIEGSEDQNAMDMIERDFYFLNFALPDESVEAFRHRMRLDIPIELYSIDGLGDYVEGPNGQVFLNVLARRPLIQVNAHQLLFKFAKKMRSSGKGRKALMALSQQAVRVVGNLNCMSTVHTSITPSVFLINERGLVYLSGLQSCVGDGNTLTEVIALPEGFLPPEILQSSGTKQEATFAMDAWELGATLFTFWCGRVPADQSEPFILPQKDGAFDLAACSISTPDEMLDLISALTNGDFSSRLLPEEAAARHPFMSLPIYHDEPSEYDSEFDDEGD